MRRNRAPETVSHETRQAKELQRQREIEAARRRAAEHPSMSAATKLQRAAWDEEKERARREAAFPSKTEWDGMTWEERDHEVAASRAAREAAATAATAGAPKVIEAPGLVLSKKLRDVFGSGTPELFTKELNERLRVAYREARRKSPAVFGDRYVVNSPDWIAGKLEKLGGNLDVGNLVNHKVFGVNATPWEHMTPLERVLWREEGQLPLSSIYFYRGKAAAPTGRFRGATHWDHLTVGTPVGTDELNVTVGSRIVDPALRAWMTSGTRTDSSSFTLVENPMSKGPIMVRPKVGDYSGRPLAGGQIGIPGEPWVHQEDAKGGEGEDRFATSRNFLATDRVPDTIFGIPVVSRREDYSEKDLEFFRKHPEAGGYYDLGDDEPVEDGTEEGAPVQDDEPKKPWKWETYIWNPEAKGGRQVDPKNIKGTGRSFDAAKERLKVPKGREAEFEKWMDELADLPKEIDAPPYALRRDGTTKGRGWLGPLKARDGSDVTEYSVGVDFGKGEVDIPTIVPTLSKDELQDMLNRVIPGKAEIPEAVMHKAVAHARERIARGLSPFKEDGGSPGKVRIQSFLVPKDWRTNTKYNADYDYVAAFLAGAEPGPLDHGPKEGWFWHMGDAGKMPTHPTFSTESYYARDPRYADLAGSWEGETYIPGKAESGVHEDAKGGKTRGKYPGIANNPGNVEKHEIRRDKTLFKGEVGGGERPKRFAVFSDPVDGLNAAAVVIARRAADLRNEGRDFTIANYAPLYAPPTENDTTQYVKNLSKYSGIPSDEVLDPHDTGRMANLLKTVVRFESGAPHSAWFTDDEYAAAAAEFMKEGAFD